MTRRTRAIARPQTATRRWLTVAALLAFFLQSFAVQTHIHAADFAPVAKLVTISHSVTPPAPPKSQDPVDQCRLCQELVHAGAFITPTSALLGSPFSQVQALPLLLLSSRAQSAPAFAWQSRAPPHR
jgi:hypothetical protein